MKTATARQKWYWAALIRQEIFGTENPLGKTVRIGDRRLRVVGVLVKAAAVWVCHTDELVIVPVATAQAMLNSNTLFRILVEARSREQTWRGKVACSER